MRRSLVLLSAAIFGVAITFKYLDEKPTEPGWDIESDTEVGNATVRCDDDCLSAALQASCSALPPAHPHSV